VQESSGRQLRMKRLYRRNPNKLLIVPLDHSVSSGPIADNERFEEILLAVADGGADAVVLHKGRLRHIPQQVYRSLSVIVHMSASTCFANDKDDKVLVASVEDAMRRGADAVSIHVNLGSKTETSQLRDFAIVSEACDRLGIPLLAMLYGRGLGLDGRPLESIIAHAGSLAADLGADIVKLSLPDDVGAVARIIAHCPLPVIAAGGAKTTDDKFIDYTSTVLKGGAAGLAAGRNIFGSKNVLEMTKRVRACIDQRMHPWINMQETVIGV